MRTYILTHANIDGDIEIAYDERGCPMSLIVRAEMKPETIYWIIEHYPLTIEDLELFRKQKFGVLEVPEDLSFDAFWAVWVGVKNNKERAARIWKKMAKKDMVRAIYVQPAFRRYNQRNTWKGDNYPDRWLYDKCFNNDYNKM